MNQTHRSPISGPLDAGGGVGETRPSEMAGEAARAEDGVGDAVSVRAGPPAAFLPFFLFNCSTALSIVLICYKYTY